MDTFTGKQQDSDIAMDKLVQDMFGSSIDLVFEPPAYGTPDEDSKVAFPELEFCCRDFEETRKKCVIDSMIHQSRWQQRAARCVSNMWWSSDMPTAEDAGTTATEQSEAPTHSKDKSPTSTLSSSLCPCPRIRTSSPTNNGSGSGSSDIEEDKDYADNAYEAGREKTPSTNRSEERTALFSALLDEMDETHESPVSPQVSDHFLRTLNDLALRTPALMDGLLESRSPTMSDLDAVMTPPDSPASTKSMKTLAIPGVYDPPSVSPRHSPRPLSALGRVPSSRGLYLEEGCPSSPGSGRHGRSLLSRGSNSRGGMGTFDELVGKDGSPIHSSHSPKGVGSPNLFRTSSVPPRDPSSSRKVLSSPFFSDNFRGERFRSAAGSPFAHSPFASSPLAITTRSPPGGGEPTSL